MHPHSHVRDDIAERILGAANQLYEQSGRTALPTVDQVRRAAKANMHDVALLMRDWRHRQQQRSQKACAVPEHLQRIADDSLSELWQAACTTAAAAFEAERSAWQHEREESEQLRRELASAYEAAVQERGRQEAAMRQVESQLAVMSEQHASIGQALAQATKERDVALAIQQEAQSHLDDLRRELERAHAAHESTHAALHALRRDSSPADAAVANSLGCSAAQSRTNDSSDPMVDGNARASQNGTSSRRRLKKND